MNASYLLLATLATPLLAQQPVRKRNSCSIAAGDADIHIHEWDSTGWFWHISTLVFIVETACPHSGASIVLSTYLEKLSIAMLQWLRANDANGGKLTKTAENVRPLGRPGGTVTAYRRLWESQSKNTERENTE